MWAPDRKSTRLNSSHLGISYAVFCLKKKKKTKNNNNTSTINSDIARSCRMHRRPVLQAAPEGRFRVSACSLAVFFFFFFFFNDTATTEIYTLSLHDALPICVTDRFAVSPVLRRRNSVS